MSTRTTASLLALLGAVSMAMAADTIELPPDSAYVTVDAQGHLSVDGTPIRLWGAIGSFPGKRETIQGDPYFRQRQAVRRAKLMGFNAFRVWHLTYDDKAQQGDLSSTDVSDFFMAECARQGVKVWAAGFGGGRLYSDEVAAAAKIIDDPATEAAWIEAISAMCKKHWWSGERTAISLLTDAVAWDPRLEALAIAQMRAKANHRNVYTGLRHADDPTIAVWELTNEQWWMRHMSGGHWQKLPAFFRSQLIARWNDWLRQRHGDDAGLTRAWGFLFPGESLAQGSVLLAPLAKQMTAVELNDTNPHALAAFQTIASPIGRDDVSPKRSEDVLAFLVETIVMHKRRFAAEVKTWGKSARLSPLIFDTGIGESIQSQYLHQQADAVSHAAYMEGVQVEKLSRTHRRWPFYSGLDSAPQLCNDVPWLEHNRTPGKPFLCYETQYGSPSKYRAEWPLRIAALASIQDWSAACYHYWTFNHYDFTSGTPYLGPLTRPGPSAVQYDYAHDEVEFATMRTAGAIFRHHLITPPAEPTVFRFGRPALLDPSSMDYAGAYGRTGLMDMMTTAYTSGMRLVIDPEQKEFLTTTGPVTRFNGFERPSPITATPQIVFDVQRSCLLFDAPGAASYTGFLQQWGSERIAFANGVTLGDIRHADPEGTPFPSGDERYCSFALASEDGLPLAETRRAVLSLVSSSFNTGLTVDREKRAFTDWGTTPVLVTRVAATVTAPALAGAKWRMIDFNERVLAEGMIAADGILRIPADQPVFLTELWRD